GDVELELAPCGEPAPGPCIRRLLDARVTGVAMALPAAEGCECLIVLDRAPKATRKLELAALGGGAGEKPDTEHLPRDVAYLSGDRKRLACEGLRVLGTSLPER